MSHLTRGFRFLFGHNRPQLVCGGFDYTLGIIASTAGAVTRLLMIVVGEIAPDGTRTIVVCGGAARPSDIAFAAIAGCAPWPVNSCGGIVI